MSNIKTRREGRIQGQKNRGGKIGMQRTRVHLDAPRLSLTNKLTGTYRSSCLFGVVYMIRAPVDITEATLLKSILKRNDIYIFCTYFDQVVSITLESIRCATFVYWYGF